MQTIAKNKREVQKPIHKAENKKRSLARAVVNSWKKIAPFWPLTKFIPINPIAGFEHLPFEKALEQANIYFQQKDIPKGMQHVNRENIKWLQAFFDDEQSIIKMPLKHLGLLKSTMMLLCFDNRVNTKVIQKKKWLKKLSEKPEEIIEGCLQYLDISTKEQETFLTIMLTTLPGWAAHIQYRTTWVDAIESQYESHVTQEEYLALRLILTCLIWPSAKELLVWHKDVKQKINVESIIRDIIQKEELYQHQLLQKLNNKSVFQQWEKPNVQLVFCIDTRSEPFRRAIEAQGYYETYSIGGFFGLPVVIENVVTGELHASCPVLLKPVFKISETPTCSHGQCHGGYKISQRIKKLYQSIKYTFATSFGLVEIIGVVSGIWMGLRNFAPKISYWIELKLKQAICLNYQMSPNIETIPFEQQVAYSLEALKLIGLINNFAQLVVFCGHGSTTKNNAYAAALNCGACGSNYGIHNACILVNILNSEKVRKALKGHGIEIPNNTYFIAAEHNTTTDNVQIYDNNVPRSIKNVTLNLKQKLKVAQKLNNFWRCAKLDANPKDNKTKEQALKNSQDWAQTRPEWGLAKNASFIIAPRWITKDINLEGRSFLHSYEWEKDHDHSSLTTILTAPMVIAQWINAQYLFSTLDNVAFGGGSKITQNITGKMGIMQGNASDLMHGLPLQSVYKTDLEPYHQPLRLTVVVYAPTSHIDLIIQNQYLLQRLFRNGWVYLFCYDPLFKKQFKLQRNLTWTKIH